MARAARSGAVACLTVVVLAACSGGGRKAAPASATVAPVKVVPHAKGPSAGCTAPGVTAPGVTDRTFVSGGVARHYQLTLPADYDGRKPLPVVFGLHALTVSYLFVPSMVGFADMEPRYDFIGVSPSGRLNGTTPYWLAALTADNYDLRFINELLDRLEAELCVDTGRVYSTGMSNGGQMSSLLACRMSDRITAVAPDSGVEFSTACRGLPVPVIAFHGTADPIVPYAGGGLDAVRIAEINYWKGKIPAGLPKHAGVDAAMRNWAAYNGCKPRPIEVRISKEVRRRTWQHCRADTVLYIVDGGGHAWPGKPIPGFEKSFGHATTDIDASQLIFQFFFSHGPA